MLLYNNRRMAAMADPFSRSANKILYRNKLFHADSTTWVRRLRLFGENRKALIASPYRLQRSHFGYFKVKGSSLILLAFYPDFSAMQLNYPLYYR
jgi:hypothetical protein